MKPHKNIVDYYANLALSAGGTVNGKRADKVATPKPKPRRPRKGPLEEEFQQQVIDLARLRGWLVSHFRKVRIQRRDGSVYWQTPVGAEGKGFPDLLMIRETKLIVAELKVPPNTTTPEQKHWLTCFRKAGALAFVWMPEDWPEIERILG